MSTNAPKQQRQIELTAGHGETYASSVMIQGTLWDFKLVFGVDVGQPSGTQLLERTLMARHTVVLSPQTAKALLTVLAINVDAYEKQCGPINIEQAMFAPPADTTLKQ